MVISGILGGLGNQLSAYACGYGIAKCLGQELVLDVSDYTHRGYFRPYCLDNLQIGPHRKLVYPPNSVGFMDEGCVPKELRNSGLRVIKLADHNTREEVAEAARGAKDVYLLGYGGMQYCTPEEQEEVKRQFQLKEPSPALERFRESIGEEYSVAVHIRRTDFVRLDWESSAAYYQAAIAYVKLFYPQAHFYFFSDDIQYAKEQFGPCENYHYVHLLGGMDADMEEFFCISACNGRIMTRQSSFSSWACELSRSENKLEICLEYENGARPRQNTVYLNQAAVGALSALYRRESLGPRASGSAHERNDAVFELVANGRNDEAIRLIDEICMDSYGLPEPDEQELTTFKAIALAQKGSGGLPAALRALYKQMQTENENPAFHANYFRALYQSGRIEESTIHAALANRLGDQEDYQEYFAKMAPFWQELYQLLRNQPRRHFIFIPMENWNYYITYVKTLAVLLARMGHKVTFFQVIGNVIESDASDGEIAEALVRQVQDTDSVYHYHIETLPCCPRHSGEGNRFLFHELVRQCAERAGLPAVVAASHPNVFMEPRVQGIKYIVPDICDPLNREHFILENSGIDLEAYISHMADHADALFLSGPAFETARKRFGDKIRRAVPAWKGKAYQILNSELDFTSNYISLNEMLQNAAELLKV